MIARLNKQSATSVNSSECDNLCYCVKSQSKAYNGRHGCVVSERTEPLVSLNKDEPQPVFHLPELTTHNFVKDSYSAEAQKFKGMHVTYWHVASYYYSCFCF